MPALKTIKAGKDSGAFIPKNIRAFELAKEDEIRKANGKPPLRRPHQVDTKQTVVPQKGKAERRVTVDIKDILPYEQEEPEAYRRQQKLIKELDTSFNQALNRWDGTIIKPQKNIIAEAIIDSQVENKELSAGDLLEKLNKFGDDMSNKEVKDGNSYNPLKAEAIARERSRRRAAELKQYGHYLDEESPDFMNGEKLPWEESKDEENKKIAIKTISMKDFLEDDTPAVGTPVAKSTAEPEHDDISITKPMSRPISSDIEF